MPPAALRMTPGELPEGAGEGAAAVAGELAVEHVARDGGGVEGDEHLRGARRGVVDDVGEDLLAGARLAGDECLRALCASLLWTCRPASLAQGGGGGLESRCQRRRSRGGDGRRGPRLDARRHTAPSARQSGAQMSRAAPVLACGAAGTSRGRHTADGRRHADTDSQHPPHGFSGARRPSPSEGDGAPEPNGLTDLRAFGRLRQPKRCPGRSGANRIRDGRRRIH